MKKKGISFILTVFFLFIEIFIYMKFYSSEIYTDLRSEFWLFHFGASIIFIAFFYFILRRDIGYYDVLIIFFPIIGVGIMVFGEIFDLKKNIENHIEEAYSVEEYKKRKEEENFINFYTDINTLSAYDFLLLEDSNIKKKFLFEFSSPDIAFKVEIYQKALLDKDVEVIHYAAIELNKLEVKLQENIKKAEESENIYDIYKAYKEYINSGLLYENVLLFYQNKTLNILLKIIEKDKDMEEELLEIYLKMNKKIEYEELIRRILEEKFSKEILEKFLEFLYRENRFREMLDLYKKYNISEIKLPTLFSDIVFADRGEKNGCDLRNM